MECLIQMWTILFGKAFEKIVFNWWEVSELVFESSRSRNGYIVVMKIHVFVVDVCDSLFYLYRDIYGL